MTVAERRIWLTSAVLVGAFALLAGYAAITGELDVAYFFRAGNDLG